MSSVKLRIAAQLLANIAEDLKRQSNGEPPLYNSNITEEEIDEIIQSLSVMSGDRISKDKAMRLLNISRATFDRQVKDGKIPQGKKTVGWKELSWSKAEIEHLITHRKDIK